MGVFGYHLSSVELLLKGLGLNRMEIMGFNFHKYI